MDLDQEKYRRIFREDADIQFEILRTHIPMLEADPGNVKAVENIYRAFHSFKGMASLMKYDDIFTLAQKNADAFNQMKKLLGKGEDPGSSIAQIGERLGLVGEGETPGITDLTEYLRISLARLEELVEKYCSG